MEPAKDPPDHTIPQDQPRGSWRHPSLHFDTCLSHPWYASIFRLSASIASESQRYLERLGSLPALAPITAHSISSPMGLGSDSEPVDINLFGHKTYLADSMQFHLEYLLRLSKQGVHYIMPTFRGEQPDSRHLNEFFHIEAEFACGLAELIPIIEGLLRACAARLIADHEDTITSFAGTIAHIKHLANADNGLQRISFADAVMVLDGDESNFKRLNGEIISLTAKAEQLLLKRFSAPVWLTHLPRLGVPFYQADATEQYASCADLLMGIGEVVGCGERHTSYEHALAGLVVRQVDPAPYDWYLRLKRDYPLRSSGFGIGLERLLLWALCHDDIRDTQIFIRQRDIYGVP